MQIKEQPIPYELTYPVSERYQTSELVFFDIETTGLSAQESYCYLIGCAYYKENKPTLIQWFCDGIQDEEQLLHNFFHFISQFKMLIHYNGSGFDLPFLMQKCQHYGLPYNFTAIDSLDIYKKIIPYRSLLPVKNLKLKTIEQFLGLKRRDAYDGRQLIELYAQYVGLASYEKMKAKHPDTYHIPAHSGLPTLGSGQSQPLLDSLLLHNAEDVMGLLKTVEILSYADALSGRFHVTNAIVSEEYVCFCAKLMWPVSIPVTLTTDLLTAIGTPKITLEVSQDTATIVVPFYHGTLKFFFDNYRDYYYLPYEDTAIHKSVGEYVDRDFRQNAKPATCYMKKEGTFLPQKAKLFNPALLAEYKEKISWFEPDDTFYADTERMTRYVASLL